MARAVAHLMTWMCGALCVIASAEKNAGRDPLESLLWATFALGLAVGYELLHWRLVESSTAAKP